MYYNDCIYESNYSHYINFYKLTFMDFLKSGGDGL